MCGAERRGGKARARAETRLQPAHASACSSFGGTWRGHLERDATGRRSIKTTKSNGNRTYLVRRLFCRASGLLSTSGGRWFATVLGECTRKASVECGLARLAAASDDCMGEDDGGIEESDMR